MAKFLGTHSRNIDDKQRIPLPRQLALQFNLLRCLCLKLGG